MKLNDAARKVIQERIDLLIGILSNAGNIEEEEKAKRTIDRRNGFRKELEELYEALEVPASDLI